MWLNLTLFILIITTNSYSLCSGSTNTNCYPCPMQCTNCSSQSLCSTCSIQYFSNSNSSLKCSSCPSNCLSCSSATVCTNCMNPYVLVNSSCSLCVISNAFSCSSTVSANVCLSGYYLSNSYCQSCLLNCASCVSAYDCSSCNSGYYLNTSIITCNTCPVGCSICNQYNPSQCTVCNNGYQLSNSICSMVTCNIPFCLFCTSVSVCKQCNLFYYWNGNECVQGGSISCENGANGPLPTNCINSCSSFSYSTGNGTSFGCKLISSVYVAPVQYSQSYFYAYNYLTQLNTLAGSNVALNMEANGEYSFPANGMISFSTLPNYYRILIAIKYSAATAITILLHAVTPSGYSQDQNHNLSSASSPIGSIINTAVVHSNNLFITPNASINIVEMWMRIWKCSSGCTICLNQQLCQLCNSPNFMLSYGCVPNCTVYIHFMPNMTCLTSCPNNYYQIVSNGLKYCQSCSSPCLDCSNATFCLSCLPGYYYFSYSCLKTCPSGYYQDNSTNLCSYCISPCQNCLSKTVCLSCSQGFWNGSVCSNNCPSGQFGDSINLVCSPCNSSCLTCITSASICTSCISTLIYYSQQCLSQCPSRFYNSSRVCVQCSPPCYECLSQNVCTSCTYNYLLDNSCIASCPIGKYADQANLICLACLPQCLTCNSATSCTSCNVGCLFSGTCLSTCPSQHYFQQTVNASCSCIQCIYPCSTCLSSNVCLSCVDGFYYNGSCLIQCPTNFYSNPKTDSCTLCNSTFSNCLICISSSCSLCEAGYNLFNSLCYQDCPIYYYKQNQLCNACVAPCLACTSAEKCLSCTLPYALLNSMCLIECPSSQIAMMVKSSLQCMPCTLPCLSCSIVQTNCTYCLYGYYLFNNTCTANCSNLASHFSYYNQLSTLTCDSCAFPCLKCLSETQCLSCRVGYLNAARYTCSQCVMGTYASNSSCLLCNSSCSICYSLIFCTACSTGHYLFNNSCTPNASLCQINGYYVAGSVCYACMQPCLTCWVTSSNCTSCLSGYMYSQPNSCLVTCPKGYYKNNNSCAACSQQCATCVTQAFYCLTCSKGYYLYLTNASCLLACPSSSYLSGQICSSCQYPCLTCSSDVSCLSCVSGVLIVDQCYSSCLSRFYADVNLKCQSCLSPCEECTLTSTQCTLCITNYWLLNSTCLASCPTNYFGESQSQQCLKCIGLCRQCTSYVNCTQCIGSYILFFSPSNNLGECISVCPAGYYLDNSCLICSSQCSTCVDANSCTTCTGNNVQYLGSCLEQCPSGMYSLGRICQSCSYPCANCIDSYTCTSCPTGFLLVGGSSCSLGPNCPSGYYLQATGSRCDTLCSSGYYNLDNGTCNNVSCGAEYFMGADMFCYISCPPGFLGNSSFYCIPCSNCEDGLFFTLEYRIIRDSLYLYLTFTQTPQLTLTPIIKLNPPFPYQSLNFGDQLVGGLLNYSGSTNLQLQLLLTQSISSTNLNVSFINPLSTFSNPLQRSYATIIIDGYDYFPTDLASFSKFGILALFCALLGIIRNPYMVDFAQILFLLGLLDCHYPFHMASFLQSTQIAHLHGFIGIPQSNSLGDGKFTYLTGIGLLTNTLANWFIIGTILGFSFLLWIWLFILKKRAMYSKVSQTHQQSLTSDERPSQSQGCQKRIQKILQNYRMRWFNRVIYFNYSIICLFTLTQLTSFSLEDTINSIAGILAIVVLPFLIYLPISLRSIEPKYTFLYLRKLLICGAVVLSLKDAIYAVGIISVCNITAFILILTYKLERYRFQSRILASCQMLQFFVLICISFFIMVGQGSQTSIKVTLGYIIVFAIMAILIIYIIVAILLLYISIHNSATDTDLRANWVLNQQEESDESHHSQSISGSMKDKAEKQEEQKRQKLSPETIIVEIHRAIDAAVEQNHIQTQSHQKPGKHHHNEHPKPKQFWTYEQSQLSQNQVQSGKNKKQVFPEMLVRCINQFSDYQPSEHQH